ncbi:MAG: tetratricopeptide repeat protein [Herminiimonas sp.]|nr:tetratricopeptide repeat protein [Herminiimonas sp.]
MSACAGGPGSPALTTTRAASGASVVADSSGDYTRMRKVRVKARSATPEDQLPPGSLTEDILLKYMSAEIANQRGDWQTAYINMMAIAQQTRDPRLAKRAAEMALNAKHPDEALAAVRLWRQSAPLSEEAQQYYLGFIMLGENLDEARPMLEQRLRAAPPSAVGPMILQVQRMLARAKNRAAANSLLSSLLAPYQAVPESHMAMAQEAALGGDQARAVAEARIALSQSPDSELAALTLAQVIADKGASATSLQNFLSTHPKAREVRLAYARILVEQKQYDQARSQFRVLLKDDPRDLTVLYALGLLETQHNDFKQAESYLTTYLEVLGADHDEDRDPTQALLILAQIAEQRNDTAAALKWLDQIDSSTPQAFLGAQIKRSELMAKEGRLDEARKLLRGIGDTEEERIQLLSAEGQLLRNANQPQEAMKVLEAGLKQYPDNTDLLYDYAMMAEKQDRLDIMETALRKVMRLAPENQQAYNALGYSLAERNMRLDEAFALIDKALKLAPEDPFIMDSMGWVQYRRGKVAEAEALLRRAYALRPDPEIATHLGEVLWVSGKREDAKKLWRDANGKDPKNDTLKSTLARLQVSL